MIERFEDYPVHDSIRGWFGRALFFEMAKNPNIILFTADLGYGLFDRIKAEFPDRFINTGAAEQAMLGAAIGAALGGKIPFCYSITPFLLGRGYEWIRNHINHEQIPVRLVGSGLDDDYKHDGITHHAHDAKNIMLHFDWILSAFPERKEAVPWLVSLMVKAHTPTFLCLRR